MNGVSSVWAGEIGQSFWLCPYCGRAWTHEDQKAYDAHISSGPCAEAPESAD